MLSPNPKQLDAGTHGLFDGPGVNASCIGKVDFTGARESWHWKNGEAWPINTVFVLKHAEAPQRDGSPAAIRAPVVFEYLGADLSVPATMTPVVDGRLYRIESDHTGIHTNPVGYLNLCTDGPKAGQLTWYIHGPYIKENRIDFEVLKALKFTIESGELQSATLGKGVEDRSPEL